MNNQSYIELAQRIRAKATGVKTIALYNRQYEEPAKHNAMPPPAVFIEFGDWVPQHQSGVERIGERTLRVHVVTNFLGDTENIDQKTGPQQTAKLAHLAIGELVNEALTGHRMASAHSVLKCQGGMVDHDHTGIIAEVYQYTFMEERPRVTTTETDATIDAVNVTGTVEDVS